MPTGIPKEVTCGSLSCEFPNDNGSNEKKVQAPKFFMNDCLFDFTEMSLSIAQNIDSEKNLFILSPLNT